MNMDKSYAVGFSNTFETKNMDSCSVAIPPETAQDP